MGDAKRVRVAADADPDALKFEWFDSDFVRVLDASASERAQGVCARFGMDGSEFVPIEDFPRLQDAEGSGGIPAAVVRTMLARRPPHTDVNESEFVACLPSPMRESIKAYQREAVAACATRHNFRMILADEPGLGKTIQSLAIAYVAARPRKPRVLVVCPAGVADNWVAEITKWTPLVAHILENKKTKKEAREREAADVFVVSVDSISLKTRALHAFVHAPERAFDAVIVDECHMLKNHGSMRSQTLAMSPSSILWTTRCVVLMSGTLVLNGRPIELYPATQCVRRGELSYDEFANRYCDARWVPALRTTIDTGKSNTTEMMLYLRSMMMRRLKNDVVELPRATRVLVLLRFARTSPEWARYRAEELKFFEALKELDVKTKAANAADSSSSVAAAKRAQREMQRLYGVLVRACGEIAAPHAWDAFARDELGRLAPDEKVIVFVHNEAVCAVVADKAKSAVPPIETAVGTGLTPESERDKLLVNLRAHDTTLKLGVLSIGAFGVGVNATPGVVLTAFFQLPPSPALLDQAEARAWRVGATRPQRFVYVVMENSIAQRMLKKHAEKARTAAWLVDGDASSKSERVFHETRTVVVESSAAPTTGSGADVDADADVDIDDETRALAEAAEEAAIAAAMNPNVDVDVDVSGGGDE